VAVRLGHRAGFGNQAAGRPGSIDGADLPDRQPHRGGHAGLRAEPGLLAAREQALRPRARAAVQVPERDAGRAAGVRDHPGAAISARRKATRRLGAVDLETLDALITRGIAGSREEAVRWALARILERPAYARLRERAREIDRLKTEF